MNYIAPELDIIAFDAEDIITTSNFTESDYVDNPTLPKIGS